MNTAPSISAAGPEPLLEQSFDCGQLQLNAAGGPRNGPPLILLHGVTRCWQDWRPVLPELMTRWQVFALDYRGHGGSEGKSDPVSVGAGEAMGAGLVDVSLRFTFG
jgi:pimeloyl-ACP methyl ester carboxylesterase